MKKYIKIINTKMAVPILESGVTFTTFEFYNTFLTNVASYYPNDKPIEFRLITGNDETAMMDRYRIDPMSIPLLLSLFEQLKNWHNTPLQFDLNNNSATIPILEFLDKGEFFHIIGDNTNPQYALGRNILKFDNRYLGGFQGKEYVPDHKVRAYSKNDYHHKTKDKIENVVNSNSYSDEGKRDYLIDEYSYRVVDHFQDLLYNNENEYTADQTNSFIQILAELIANGIMHSGTDVYAMMFVNRFSTRFSISDNGIGLGQSLSKKTDAFYKNKELATLLDTVIIPFSLPKSMKDNLQVIFETLFYSMIKKRVGLFDLMSNVVLGGQGYFRLHTERTQIIISNRMGKYLRELSIVREQIRGCYYSEKECEIEGLTSQAKNIFKIFYADTINKYSEDVKYSNIRFYGVKFNGVHIEVEIPNR